MVRATLTAALFTGAMLVTGPSIAMAQNWSGPYAGIHAGYAWGKADYLIYPYNFGDAGLIMMDRGSGSQRLSGGGGGAHAGRNWQSGRFVVGAEAEFDILNASLSANTGPYLTGTIATSIFRYRAKIDSLATLRARFGLVGGNAESWLIYVTGGLAVGRVRSEFSQYRPISGYQTEGSETTWRAGGAVGGGIEAALNRNWLLRAEYLYVDLGRMDAYNTRQIDNNPIYHETASMSARMHMARLGLSYQWHDDNRRVASRSNAAGAWDGFYLGGHAGHGWGNSHDARTTAISTPASANIADASTSLSTSGYFGGVQTGYNMTIAPRWIAGAEADFSFSGMKGDARTTPALSFAGTPIPNSYQEVSQRLDWFGTLRGRAGYLATERLMLFATAGLAYGQVKHSAYSYFGALPVLQFGGSGSDTRLGWTVGGGAEWKVAGPWSAKLEYLYFDLGDNSVVVQQRAVPVVNESFRLITDNFKTTGHLVRVGLNYRFNQ